MKYLIGLFILLFSVNVMADQLIISRSRTAYVLNVDDRDACINAIINISNIDIHSDVKLINVRQFFRLKFICINRDGAITEYGNIYQIPYITNKMCLAHSNWSGVYLIDECKTDRFTTRVVITRLSISNYVINYNDN